MLQPCTGLAKLKHGEAAWWLVKNREVNRDPSEAILLDFCGDTYIISRCSVQMDPTDSLSILGPTGWGQWHRRRRRSSVRSRSGCVSSWNISSQTLGELPPPIPTYKLWVTSQTIFGLKSLSDSVAEIWNKKSSLKSPEKVWSWKSPWSQLRFKSSSGSQKRPFSALLGQKKWKFSALTGKLQVLFPLWSAWGCSQINSFPTRAGN